MKLRGWKPALGYLILGSVLGLVENEIRPDSIPLVAAELQAVADSVNTLPADSLAGIHLIGLTQAKAYYEQGVPFVDARDIEEYTAGHIAGALPNPNFMELVFRLDTLQTRDDLLITYCDDPECGLSKNLAYDLQATGFTHLLVFEGGWTAWKEAGYP
ncbi:MAG: hypothetical protein D6762_06590, partial [Candidatus Neomarinimicrobiota bacterium]